jgi:hypothetical protein
VRPEVDFHLDGLAACVEVVAHSFGTPDTVGVELLGE